MIKKEKNNTFLTCLYVFVNLHLVFLFSTLVSLLALFVYYDSDSGPDLQAVLRSTITIWGVVSLSLFFLGSIFYNFVLDKYYRRSSSNIGRLMNALDKCAWNFVKESEGELVVYFCSIGNIKVKLVECLQGSRKVDVEIDGKSVISGFMDNELDYLRTMIVRNKYKFDATNKEKEVLLNKEVIQQALINLDRDLSCSKSIE